MIALRPISLGSRNGVGAGITLLDGTYRVLGDPIGALGIGNVSIPITVAVDQGTGFYVRLVDYRDSTKPRLVQSTLQSSTASALADPAETAGEHVITVAGNYMVTCPLGGIVDVLAVQVKATTAGALTAADSMTGEITLTDGGI